VPRRRGEDQVERLTGGRSPFVVRGVDDRDLGEHVEVAPGHGSELLAQLETGEAETSTRQGRRCLARAAADFEQVIARLQIGQPCQVIEELFGIVRSRLVITVRRSVEGPAQPEAVLRCSVVRHVPIFAVSA